MFTYIIGSSEDLPYFQVQLQGRICLPPSTPTPFNPEFRLEAVVSLLRPRVTYHSSNGILTVSSIGISQRMILRPRLTLIRLALIRKPESFGEGVSRPLCRYLYLHLLFQTLQNTLRYAFNADWNAPLPYRMRGIHSFGNMLMPDYYPCFATRLVSCYALFK